MIKGDAELQKKLKMIQRDLKKKCQEALKAGAQIVVAEANANTPTRTGKLKGATKAFATNKGYGVRNTKKYANANHWGTGARKGKRGPHNIRKKTWLFDAVQTKKEQVMREVREAVDEILGS